MKNSIAFDHFYGVIRIYAIIKIMSMAPNYYTFCATVSCFVRETAAEEEKKVIEGLAIYTDQIHLCVCMCGMSNAAQYSTFEFEPSSKASSMKKHSFFHDLFTRSKEANGKCVLRCVAFMLNVEPGDGSRCSVCGVSENGVSIDPDNSRPPTDKIRIFDL